MDSSDPEAMAKEAEPVSRLHDLARALMSDDDPDRLIICMEVRSFFSFINTMIDKILHGGLSLHQFRKILDSKTALIRDLGYPELAQSIIEDLNQLESKLHRLRELQSAGVSSYIAAQIESRLEEWRDAHVLVKLDVQMQQDRVAQIRTVFAEKSTSLTHVRSCIASVEAEIGQLRQELQMKEEYLGILESTRVADEEAQNAISDQLKLSEQELLEAEEKAATILSTNEESFKARLQEELQQAYSGELSHLEQQIYCHKLDV